MLARICSYLRAHHIGLIALFVALGGTSYAALKLPANSVGTKQLKKDAVTLKKIDRSARKALEGQQGDTGARGPTGATGATGLRGPQGPGATRLDWSGTQAGTTTTLFSRQGLTVIAKCGLNAPTVTLEFGAAGPSATANATWTRQVSLDPATTHTHQGGAANGNVPVSAGTSSGFVRLEGQAVLRTDGLVVSVAFHAVIVVTGPFSSSCKVDGTATPAT